jgi:hypothetical protein
MARVVKWDNPTAYTDGSTYGQQDNAGYTIQLDGVGAISVPLAWGTSFDISTLSAYAALKRGTHKVAVAAVSKEGAQSDFSAPSPFPVVFPPMAPTNVQVA